MNNLKLIFLLGALTLGNLAFAQQRFEGSLVGGAVLAQIDGDRLAGFNKLGFQAGARVNTILTDRWAFGIELLFTQHGSSRDLNDDLSAVYDKINLNLVEAPVMLYFRDWKFQIGAGISYGRVINVKAIDVFGEDVSDSQNYRNDLFIFNIGVAYQFSEDWALDVRWSKYITNLQADSAAGTFLGKNIAIRGIYTL
jgi:opacity protein-like surface antigen